MATLVKNVVQRISPHQAQDMCEICGKKPKYVEKGYKHPYCSRTCARNGIGAVTSGQQAGSFSGRFTPTGSPGLTACALPGCKLTSRPAFAGFCSEAHAKEGVRQGQVEGCSMCRVQPQSATGRGLCVACDQIATRDGTRLKQLNPSETRKQFISEWDSRNEGGLPTVDKIYEVILQRDARTRYSAYRKRLSAPREQHTFHASQCICDLGVKPGDSPLCAFKSCGICNILKSSFRAFAFEEKCNNGRFGDGIYSYKNPYLADAFATSCTSSPYRVMIACDVLVEKDVEVPDEKSLFVDTPDAINPAYVILYSKS